jgi:hypothetical protein
MRPGYPPEPDLWAFIRKVLKRRYFVEPDSSTDSITDAFTAGVVQA